MEYCAQAITELARHISEGLRQSDTAARLGGDEFGVILAQTAERTGASLVMKRLLRRIEKPFLSEGMELRLRASGGLALFPEDGREIDVLLEQADHAMYVEKRLRKQFKYVSSFNNPTNQRSSRLST